MVCMMMLISYTGYYLYFAAGPYKLKETNVTTVSQYQLLRKCDGLFYPCYHKKVRKSPFKQMFEIESISP